MCQNIFSYLIIILKKVVYKQNFLTSLNIMVPKIVILQYFGMQMTHQVPSRSCPLGGNLPNPFALLIDGSAQILLCFLHPWARTPKNHPARVDGTSKVFVGGCVLTFISSKYMLHRCERECAKRRLGWRTRQHVQTIAKR